MPMSYHPYYNEYAIPAYTVITAVRRTLLSLIRRVHTLAELAGNLCCYGNAETRKRSVRSDDVGPCRIVRDSQQLRVVIRTDSDLCRIQCIINCYNDL